MGILQKKVSAKSDYDLALVAASLKQPDLKRAATLLENAHKTGDCRATYALATWYLHGCAGYKKNPTKAINYLKIAVISDLPEAHFDLAVCYETGKGIKKDEVKAYLHYLAAALNGDFNAYAEVGRSLYHGLGTTKDVEAAEVWLRRADAMDVHIR